MGNYHFETVKEQRVVVCDDCGFTYNDGHKIDGTDAEYGCPVCSEGRLQTALHAIVDAATMPFGQWTVIYPEFKFLNIYEIARQALDKESRE